jgi:hypothetical protein
VNLGGAAGALADLFGDLKAVERLLGQQGEDGEFTASPRDFGANALGHMCPEIAV